MMGKQRLLVGVLVTCFGISMTVGFAGCGGEGNNGESQTAGGGVIVPVLNWIVGFATETGNWVTAKAENFATALADAWRAFWGTDIIGNVKPDKDDPLKGTYVGIMKAVAIWGKASEDDGEPGNRMEIKLDHPRMIRKSPDSTEWELAPREIDRIDELRKQLLSAG